MIATRLWYKTNIHVCSFIIKPTLLSQWLTVPEQEKMKFHPKIPRRLLRVQRYKCDRQQEDQNPLSIHEKKALHDESLEIPNYSTHCFLVNQSVNLPSYLQKLTLYDSASMLLGLSNLMVWMGVLRYFEYFKKYNVSNLENILVTVIACLIGEFKVCCANFSMAASELLTKNNARSNVFTL